MRLVLRLPTKTRDGSIIPAVVGVAGDAEALLEKEICPHLREDCGVRNVSMSPAPKTGVGMRKIRFSSCCIWLKFGCARLQVPPSERPANGKERVRQDRAILLEEERNFIQCTVGCGCFPLRIRTDVWILIHPWAGATDGRLRVTAVATV